MMDKERASQTLNYFTGGKADEMFCYRVYVERTLRGGEWAALSWCINLVFWYLRGERDHVRRVYLKQRRRR